MTKKKMPKVPKAPDMKVQKAMLWEARKEMAGEMAAKTGLFLFIALCMLGVVAFWTGIIILLWKFILW